MRRRRPPPVNPKPAKCTGEPRRRAGHPPALHGVPPCRGGHRGVSDKLVLRSPRHSAGLPPGGVAEWLRQGPAKPCTPVRFRSPPPTKVPLRGYIGGLEVGMILA